MNRILIWRGLAASMQLGLGSTRALACSDRRLAGRNGCVNPSLNGHWFGCADVVGEGADHCTRGRVARARALRYRFEIIDTGKGIAAENLKNLFQPFHQGAEGVKKGGTGLGLAITRRQVELMGGTIDVESHPGKGSRFFFEVPLAPAKAQVAARTAEPAREVLRLAVGCTVKALVVDDVRQNREVLSQLLGGIGCQVDLAEDGLGALERLRAAMPDIVFMDIRMPGMEGPEVARRMFEEFGPDRVKLIAISASVFAHERQSYLEAGFDAFVGKPFRFGEICEILRRLLKVEFTYAEGKPEPAVVSTVPDPRQLILPAGLRQMLKEAAKRHSVTKLE